MPLTLFLLTKKSALILRMQQNAILKDVISFSSVNTVLPAGYNVSCLEVIFYTIKAVLVSSEGISSPELECYFFFSSRHYIVLTASASTKEHHLEW